jgi:CheY-like chemotaxis protein
MPHDIDVLVVEDNRILRDQLVVTLAKEGLTVRGASNGRKALQEMQSWRPKVMVTDIYMPEMEGLELIRLTRTMWTDLKIIAMTGGSEVFGNYLSAATVLGADAILQKPFMRSDLSQLVTQMVARKERAPALIT